MAKAVRPPLDHLLALSDDTGIIQHAIFDVPNRATGYCTDDVSRAFIVALQRLRAEPTNATLKKLAGIYLAFLLDAQMADGWFHNFMSYDRDWLDERGTQDSFGRTLWALGYGMRFARRKSWREVCARLLECGVAANRRSCLSAIASLRDFGPLACDEVGRNGGASSLSGRDARTCE